MTTSAKFKQVLELITSKVGVENATVETGHLLSTIPDEFWEEIDDKISDLEDDDIQSLDSAISDLSKDLQAGDMWTLMLLSKKLMDAKWTIESLQFGEQLENNSDELSIVSSKLWSSIQDLGEFDSFDDQKSKHLCDLVKDGMIYLIEAAIRDSDEELFEEIASFYFDIRNSDDIDGCSQELAVFCREQMDPNYIDELVDSAIFVLREIYDVEEDDIRDEDEGISVSLIAEQLTSLI